MKRLSKIELIVISLILFCVIWFTLLYRLDANAVFPFDEARLAVSALEMTQTGNWFIPTFDYVPDMWNVKPPLMIILQAICMKILGYNELAVRLPTSVASVATMILLLWFSVARLNNLLIGLCAVLFLCTSEGYVCEHVARTGDNDALLIFFLTSYFLFAYTFLLTGKYSFYLLFCSSLLFAVFTKGIAGAFLLPGTLLLLIQDQEIRKKIFHLKYLLPFVLVVLSIVSYYLIRESYNHGYIQTVIYEEMSGRLFSENFDLNRPWHFYFKQLVVKDFNPWWVLLPLSIPFYFKADLNERKLIWGIWLTLSIFWIPLAISVNKNTWYSAPSFPLLSLLSAIIFIKICMYFLEDIKPRYFKKIILFIVIFFICVYPFINIFTKATSLNERIGVAELVKLNRIPSDTKIISSLYNFPLNFYHKVLKTKGINAQLIFSDQIKKGDMVLVSRRIDIETIKQKFECAVIYSLGEVEMLSIKE